MSISQFYPLEKAVIDMIILPLTYSNTELGK